MKLAELLTALGGGALVGWVSKAFMAREDRLAKEAHSKVAITKEDHATGKHALDLLGAEMNHTREIGNKLDDCQERYDSLRAEVEALKVVTHYHNTECEPRFRRLETSLEAMSRVLIEKGLMPILEEPEDEDRQI